MFEDRFEDALAHFDRTVHLNPQVGLMHAFRAAALVLAGRAEEAGPTIAKALELDPSLRWGRIMQLLHPALAEKWARGLRLAGLPE